MSEYLAANGTTAAHFEYDPFGNTVFNTDTSNQFAYRFSTKLRDSETGLYYYGYRYYDPVTGRWPSRDTLQEKGGLNLYSFISNDLVGLADYLGLCELGSSRIDSSEAKMTSATDSENSDSTKEGAIEKLLAWIAKKLGAAERVRPQVPNQLHAGWGWVATLNYSCCECEEGEADPKWVSKSDLTSSNFSFASEADAQRGSELGIADLEDQVACE